MKYLFVFLVLGLMVSCGDATGDATGDYFKTSEQPKCDEIEGFNRGTYHPRKEVPKDYTGVVKSCEEGKVIYLSNYKEDHRHF